MFCNKTFISRISVLSRFWPFVCKLCTGHLYMTSLHIRRAHLWDTWHSPGPQSKCWQTSHQCHRERQKKTLQYLLHWDAFSIPLFSHFSPSLVCKQSLTSSCTHLTPNPSERALSGARGQRSGGLRSTQLTLQGNCTPQWFVTFPPFFLSPVLCLLTHLSHAPSVDFFVFFFPPLSAVDEAWECLLFSCCCQQSCFNRQEHTREELNVWKLTELMLVHIEPQLWDMHMNIYKKKE